MISDPWIYYVAFGKETVSEQWFDSGFLATWMPLNFALNPAIPLQQWQA
jgi:hypothetical protein